MRLYYRADSRSPQTIFKKGFMPREQFNNNGRPWWQQGIRDQNESDGLPKTNAVDADMDKVICLSKKLESTPLFPICDQYHTDYDSEVYIYVMALPDAAAPSDINAQDNIDVFDMQAFQAQQVKEIINNPKLSVNPAMAGYVLSGHEVFSAAVPTQNIIYAVKCKRSDFAFTAGLPVFTKITDDATNFSVSQTRYFEIGHEIFENPQYSQDMQFKSEALKKLEEVKAKGWQLTSSVEDALNECGIEYDQKQIHTSTYFWQELKSFHFGMAFFSVLESIYYAAIQLCKYVMKTSAQKPMEIEDFPVSQSKSMSCYGRYFTTVGLITGEADPYSAYQVRHGF